MATFGLAMGHLTKSTDASGPSAARRSVSGPLAPRIGIQADGREGPLLQQAERSAAEWAQLDQRDRVTERETRVGTAS